MKEWIMILMGVLGVGLFAAGGTGYKWMRRYLMPALFFPCLMLLGVTWWVAAIACGILMGVLTLGYGESTPWWLKALVGISYAIPSLVIGWSWWAVIVPVVFIVLFMLSNWSKTADSFTWKVVEMQYGLVIAISLIQASLNGWGW
jgi:hypothetical protein